VNDLLEGLGADLLLAFNKKAQCHWNLAQLLQGFEGVDARHHVRLVVGDAARVDPIAALARLERRRVP